MLGWKLSNGSDIEHQSSLMSELFSLGGCSNYKIYLVRHLQKDLAGDKADPDLSLEGHKNAESLAKIELGEQLSVGFHSQFKRTKHTLQPIAQRYQLPLIEYDARNGQALVDLIAKQYCGQKLIISGHSNTIPDLLQKLGGQFQVSFAGYPLAKQPHISLSEDDYGTIFLLENVVIRFTQK